ncbi:DinB family protein [Nocardioides litoris]|uniref:DinB family protein n=1 Tax=Nocardioides litoris TaxID=1926648 RepID=UPI001FE9A3D7|nr:DinB family protein [Nocardioides litoris]
MTRDLVDTDLSGTRFVRCDLSGAVMRGVQVTGADVDAPWLVRDGGPFLVNGVDVTAFVDAELDRRFPGRALRHATDPAGLREAWAAVEAQWAATVDRAAGLPDGSVDVRVDGEWSFAETLRHLVMATDTWLRGGVLEVERPWHPFGVPNAEYETDGHDMSVWATDPPTWPQVLEVRAERVAMVRDVVAATTEADLAAQRRHPWAAPDSEHRVTVLACLRTVLEEEWEHHRYAVRDLAVLASRGPSGPA